MYECSECGRRRPDHSLSSGSLALANLTRSHAADAVDLLPDEDLVCLECEESEFAEEYEDPGDQYFNGQKIAGGVEILVDGVYQEFSALDFDRLRQNY